MKKLKFAVIAIIFGILTISLSACAVQQKPDLKLYKKHYMSAVQDYKAKDYKSMQKNAKAAMSYSEKPLEAKGLLALAYFLDNDIKNAEKVSKEIIKDYPNNNLGYRLLGEIKLSQGNFTETIDLYEKGMSVSDEDIQKKFFKKAIADVIKQQNQVSKGTKPNLTFNIDLDKTKWEIAHFAEDEYASLTEFGLIGEDVIHYKWTKLVSVNTYKGATKDAFTTLKEGFKESLQNHANNMNSKLIFEDIPSNNDEILFKWTIENRGECEVCRIFAQNNNVYFVHFAQKKDKFSDKELSDALKILKSVKGL